MKRLSTLILCFLLVLVFSACGSKTDDSSSSVKAKNTGSFIKSFDGGKNWENKVTIDDKSNIGNSNILSMAVNFQDSNIIYAGTEKDGLFVTKNGADVWEKINFPLTKIYGLAIDRNDGQIIYASGILGKRAKVFKSLNGGVEWKEIYTEPSDGTTISSLRISPSDPRIIYCGTNDGMILKSFDGGQSWKNLFKSNGPIIDVSFDYFDSNIVYFGVFNGSVLRTLDGGNKIEDLGKIDLGKFIKGKSFVWSTYSVVCDPQDKGVLYVGMEDGLFRGTDFGNKWEEVNILESSKKFPIRGLAINPKNSNEIIYSNSGAIYSSSNRGESWVTFQLSTKKVIEVIEYDAISPNNVYAGLRET